MIRRCKFDNSKFCYHSCCDLGLDAGLCPLFRGGKRFTARKVVQCNFSIFDIWAGKRSS